MIRRILKQLEVHAPFTTLGALSGIFIILVFRNIPHDVSYNIFYVLHPLHVFLSALVTASIYKLHRCGHVTTSCLSGKCNFWALTIIGYAGSIGIATLSDSVIPYLGETLLGLPDREIHLGFIEKWYLVNPLALLGITIAYFRPTTKFPHFGHVLLSTWASLFHIMMAMSGALSWPYYVAIFVFLFLAVWLPCCLSDIVFPLLFVRDKKPQPA